MTFRWASSGLLALRGAGPPVGAHGPHFPFDQIYAISFTQASEQLHAVKPHPTDPCRTPLLRPAFRVRRIMRLSGGAISYGARAISGRRFMGWTRSPGTR